MNLKHYRVTLPKNPDKSLVYPANYQEEIGNYALDHLYYSDSGQDYLLLVLPADAQNIIRDNVSELSEEQAKAISEANELRKEVIQDEAKITRIQTQLSLINAKLGANVALDTAETAFLSAPETAASLDPTSSETGITMGKILADRIENLKII